MCMWFLCVFVSCFNVHSYLHRTWPRDVTMGQTLKWANLKWKSQKIFKGNRTLSLSLSLSHIPWGHHRALYHAPPCAPTNPKQFFHISPIRVLVTPRKYQVKNRIIIYCVWGSIHELEKCQTCQRGRVSHLMSFVSNTTNFSPFPREVRREVIDRMTSFSLWTRLYVKN